MMKGRPGPLALLLLVEGSLIGLVLLSGLVVLAYDVQMVVHWTPGASRGFHFASQPHHLALLVTLVWTAVTVVGFARQGRGTWEMAGKPVLPRGRGPITMAALVVATLTLGGVGTVVETLAQGGVVGTFASDLVQVGADAAALALTWQVWEALKGVASYSPLRGRRSTKWEGSTS